MDPAANPFGLLTFIVAPAILTNAASVMSLGTANRFARTIDRARSLSSWLEGKHSETDPETKLRVRQLGYAERRALLLVRALTAFYLAVGSFAAASLISLFSAVFFIARSDVLHQTTLAVAFAAGVLGVAGLVTGTALLVLETRMALAVLQEQTQFMSRTPDREPQK